MADQAPPDGTPYFSAEAAASAYEPGQDVTILVIPSATRTTLFPEQVIVVPSSTQAGVNGIIELVFLPQEMTVQARIGKVASVGPEGVNLDMQQAALGLQLTDIGHARLNTDQAIDMAVLVIQSVVQRQGRELSAIIERLQTPTGAAT